jgi:hypothetical protein
MRLDDLPLVAAFTCASSINSASIIGAFTARYIDNGSPYDCGRKAMTVKQRFDFGR